MLLEFVKLLQLMLLFPVELHIWAQKVFFGLNGFRIVVLAFGFIMTVSRRISFIISIPRRWSWVMPIFSIVSTSRPTMPLFFMSTLTFAWFRPRLFWWRSWIWSATMMFFTVLFLLLILLMLLIFPPSVLKCFYLFPNLLHLKRVLKNFMPSVKLFLLDVNHWILHHFEKGFIFRCGKWIVRLLWGITGPCIRFPIGLR